jgi:hypothetical protein
MNAQINTISKANTAIEWNINEYIYSVFPFLTNITVLMSNPTTINGKMKIKNKPARPGA